MSGPNQYKMRNPSHNTKVLICISIQNLSGETLLSSGEMGSLFHVFGSETKLGESSEEVHLALKDMYPFLLVVCSS